MSLSPVLMNGAASTGASAVPDEIIASGNFEAAQNFLVKNGASATGASGAAEVSGPEILTEHFYRLGNRFYAAQQRQAAEQAWRQSGRSAGIATEAEEVPESDFANLRNRKFRRQLHWQTFGAVLLVIFCLYVPVFTLFQRQAEPFQMLTGGSLSSAERSFWEEFWDTGRPVSHPSGLRYGAEDLWPLLQETLKNLLGQNESKDSKLSNSVREKLKQWLERAQHPQLKQGPTDYYALTGRGLFDTREFEESISTLRDGLRYAESGMELEQLYQDLGTVYYYKGYKLLPDGLARYELADVQDSVEAYEQALRFGEDPYLYGNLGWGYYLLGDYDSAISNSRRALALSPGLNYARMNLGIAHLRNGEYELSFAAYASLLEHSPALDEYEGGIRDLQELQREFPTSAASGGRYPFSDFVLGQLYRQQGRHRESRTAFQKFLQQNFPQSSWRERARLLLKKMSSE